MSRATAARIVLAAVAAGAIGVAFVGVRQPYAALRSWEVVRALGWLATLFLVGALAITPLQRVLERGRLVALRRSLGLAAASCGALHAVTAFLGIPGLAAMVLYTPWVRAGLGAMLLLLALFATSFDVVLRRLRLQHWKELHRLVYPTALCVLLHALLGPFGTPAFELALALSLALLLVLRIALTFTRKTSASE